jgi:lipopolysaccharide/colanic/teichoic acid biosynthesis glycosyltransferase
MLILLPFFLATALYIYFLDGRPIVLKQQRVGLHGDTFSMFKFRTMKNDSHGKRTDLETLNEHNGPLFKIKDDPRIIYGASNLRKYSIDELPQIFNVLIGNMSLVGPRPLFPEDSKHFDEHYLRRLNVLPGITGFLQINERNTNDFNIWYKYDIEYIENWSILLDLKIIMKTPAALFSKKTSGE